MGNTHDDKTNMGWDKFHNMIAEYKTLPKDVRPYIETFDIEVFPIDKNTVWVKGKLKIVYPNGKLSNNYFYDSLLKTKDCWKVFNSVVNTIHDCLSCI